MTNIGDFDEDAGVRILQCLADNDIPFRANLRAAAKTAGEALEWFKPFVFTKTPQGTIGGPVADVKHGGMVIVLADAKKIVRFVTPLPTDNQLSELIGLVRNCKPTQEGTWAPRDTTGFIGFTLKKSGWPPTDKRNKDTIFASTYGGTALGGLFAAYSPDQRRALLARCADLIELDICPALIGLVGAASSGRTDKFSCAWPLLLPLSSYHEAMMEDAAVSLNGSQC